MSAYTPTTATGRLTPNVMSSLLAALVAYLECGRLSVWLPDGNVRVFEGSASGPEAQLKINRSRFFRRVLTGGCLGFAEAYMDGDCDSPDLLPLLLLAARNEATVENRFEGRGWYNFIQHLVHAGRMNSKRGSRRNIAKHYDLGNDFYALWLDPTLTYSAASFGNQDEDLENAQRIKFREIATLADLRPEQRVLEIGCGWGSFATWAAREIGCHVTAITISRSQYRYAAQQIAAAGLQDRIELRFQDYRDLSGTFDRVISIEMLEAVGEKYWPAFFGKLHEVLTPGGRAALQVITMSDERFDAYRASVDFVQRYIFPGGMLPAPTVLRRRVSDAQLYWAESRALGMHYAETLSRWRERFLRVWPKISELGYDERFRRMWSYYLAYCEAGFRERRIDLMQFALCKA